MKHIIYCISLIIVAICAFILGQMQANDRPAMIGLKTDGITIKDGIWIGIDGVDKDRTPEGCVLETANDKDYERLENFRLIQEDKAAIEKLKKELEYFQHQDGKDIQ